MNRKREIKALIPLYMIWKLKKKLRIIGGLLTEKIGLRH
jgi:hypothetical protein